MRISSGTFPSSFDFGASLSIRAARTRAAGNATLADTAGASRRTLDAISQRLQRAAEALQDVLGVRARGTRARPAAVVGSTLTSLRIQPTAARLTSTTEINGVATSFTPRGPSFAGSSSATPTIGGVYDGDQGDGALRFVASSGGIVGLTPVQIQVRNGQNQLVQTLGFGFGYSAGSPRTLNNGLTMSLGGGTVAAGDSFEVAVSVTTGSTVAIANPFNGTRNANPNFDPGVTVQAGTFAVNGTSIAVAASDSIQSVLARITASAAGVTASFNAVTEQLELVQKSSGSAAHITLGSDSSGFLAATKLTGAVATPGLDDERTLALAEVAAFAGVTSGSFTLNGVQVAVDVLTDSIDDLVARIDSQLDDVDASFDGKQRRLRLTATDGGSLAIENDTTGLLTRVGIATGTIEAIEGKSGKPAFQKPRDVRARLEEFGRALEDLFGARYSSAASPAAAFVQGKVRTALATAFRDATGRTVADQQPLQAHGLTFHLAPTADAVFDFDTTALRRATERDARELAALLAGTSNDGITGRLGDLFDSLDGDLRRLFGASTGSVDVLA